MSAPAGIPPYGERDEELARAAVAQVVRREGEPAGLLREVAGACATARAEGMRAALAARDAERADGLCDCTACLLENLGLDE